ncbi:hypothetical protein JKP75_00685 [Blastococcus sp. TML/M2B]|uniref:hypothetical protein n=1 Tax=unclassified Blastococcus TaxID=2619396 RepID=UPI00190BC4CE|nr:MULTISPECIES: hypothetical protein [unclassified Blastococcus]MBN1091239.1 hypothetical protein [Blastococcus sp. TML/M2B]MBN1095205.1 hypothetical protein [Blastococcus sp. TML/C7B]
MDAAGFTGLLEEVTHDGFMGVTAVLATVTVVMLALAVRRILPGHERDDTLPPRGGNP